MSSGTMTMPPLPTGHTIGSGIFNGQKLFTADQMRDYANKCVASERDFWRVEGDKWRDQMRAYGEACAAAERERCAKLCKDYAIHHARNDDDTTSAQAWMMLQCAAAIRAQGEAP